MHFENMPVFFFKYLHLEIKLRCIAITVSYDTRPFSRNLQNKIEIQTFAVTPCKTFQKIILKADKIWTGWRLNEHY